jgi:hypothetical protein
MKTVFEKAGQWGVETEGKSKAEVIREISSLRYHNIDPKIFGLCKVLAAIFEVNEVVPSELDHYVRQLGVEHMMPTPGKPYIALENRRLLRELGYKIPRGVANARRDWKDKAKVLLQESHKRFKERMGCG